MKQIYCCILLGFSALVISSCDETTQKNSNEQSVLKKVDASFFLTDNINFKIAIIDCTLSDGTKTTCYEINTKGLTPADHEMGPWCPEHIADEAEKGGLWFKDGKVYNVDGEFIKDLPALYHDDHWHLHDEQGNINKTLTEEDCIKLANAKLVEEFTNYCIECLPEYVSNLSKKYVIPITPVKLKTPINLGPPKGKKPSGDKPKGPPPGGGGKKGPAVRGIAFNGVAFDAPAPLHLILGGYTIPPIDHAGGHINLDVGYHYHAATGVSKEIEQKDGHAPMIGYAMDGFGLYAQLNTDGKEPQDLDNCRGHYDEIRGYHYHVDAAGNNNFINCFSGAISQ